MPPHDEAAPAIISIPAIGVSVTTVLGGNRQMVIQTHFPGDAPAAEGNICVDKLLGFADRAKARYELEELEDQFHEVGRELRLGINSLPLCEADFHKELDDLGTKISDAEARRLDIYNTGAAEFSNAGKAGPYSPSGAVKQQIAAISHDIIQLKTLVKSAPGERDQRLMMIHGKIRHYQMDLEKRRKKLNELRSLAGQVPMEDYLDLQNWSPPEPTTA